MCTTLILPYTDGCLLGSNMDYAFNYNANLLFIPRQSECYDNLNFASPIATLTTQHAVMGINCYSSTSVNDGMNEHGLMGCANYAPNAPEYPTVPDSTKTFAMSSYMVLTFLLGNCKDVNEVINMLNYIDITNLALIESGFTVPLQFAFADKSGASIVVEYDKHSWLVHDNMIGTITNTYNFNWLVNLYQACLDNAKISIDCIGIQTLKEKFFDDVPSFVKTNRDYRSILRFIRAAYALQNAPIAGNEIHAINQYFQLLKSFTIPYGLYYDETTQSMETTLYSVCFDSNSKKAYVSTIHDMNIHSYSFSDFDLDADEVTYIAFPQSTSFITEQGTVTKQSKYA